jgi:hypothetical protein
MTVTANVVGPGVSVLASFGTNAEYTRAWMPIISRLGLVWARRFHTSIVVGPTDFPAIIAELGLLAQALEDAGERYSAGQAKAVVDGMRAAADSPDSHATFG